VTDQRRIGTKVYNAAEYAEIRSANLIDSSYQAYRPDPDQTINEIGPVMAFP